MLFARICMARAARVCARTKHAIELKLNREASSLEVWQALNLAWRASTFQRSERQIAEISNILKDFRFSSRAA